MTGTFSGDCDGRGRIAFDIPAQVTAFCGAHFAGQRVDVEIRVRKVKRTDRQNRALHRCLSLWAKDKGHDVEQLKDDLLALCWGYVVRQNLLTGEIVKSLVKPHTAALSVEEFTLLFDHAAIEAAKDGHVMEMPDEFKARQSKRRVA